MLVLSYFPLLGLAVLSFSDQPMSGLPYPFTLAWYRHLLEDTRWVGPVRTSFVISTAVGVAAMLLATMIGRTIPRLHRSGAVLSAFILPLFVPGVAMGVALFLYYRGLLDLRLGLWSLFLGQFVWAFPFCLLFRSCGLQPV